jgi:hypothetical protein
MRGPSVEACPQTGDDVTTRLPIAVRAPMPSGRWQCLLERIELFGPIGDHQQQLHRLVAAKRIAGGVGEFADQSDHVAAQRGDTGEPLRVPLPAPCSKHGQRIGCNDSRQRPRGVVRGERVFRRSQSAPSTSYPALIMAAIDAPPGSACLPPRAGHPVTRSFY